MDEKTSRDPPPTYHEGQTKTSELDEAANPDSSGRRQAAGINIVQNPLMVSCNISCSIAFEGLAEHES